MYNETVAKPDEWFFWRGGAGDKNLGFLRDFCTNIELRVPQIAKIFGKVPSKIAFRNSFITLLNWDSLL